MAKYMGSNLTATFNGVTIQSFSINESIDPIEIVGWNSLRSFIGGRRDVSVSFDIVETTTDINRFSRPSYWENVGSGLSIASLGDTIVCAHCNFAIRPGAIFCTRCGSLQRDTVKNSRLNNFGQFIITKSETTNQYDYNVIHVDMRVVGGRFTANNIQGILHNKWTTTYRENGWLCAYCHSVNKDDVDSCAYCGAGELPYSDLSRISTTCLYCGVSLRGNTICDHCGSASNGYSAWLPHVH